MTEGQILVNKLFEIFKTNTNPNEVEIQTVQEIQEVYMKYIESIRTSSEKKYNAPYHDITKKVLWTETKDMVNIDDFIQFYMEMSAFNDEKFNWADFMVSFEKHYKLAVVQKEYIHSMFGTMKKDVGDAKLKVDEIKRVKSTIYTEFIAILGIFSALIFGLFGSFDAISTSLVKISEQSSPSQAIVFICMLIAPLLLLIYGLLYWVGKLSNRQVNSCNCCKECKCSFFEKHKMVVIIESIVLFIGLCGVMGNILDKLPIGQGYWLGLQSVVLIVLLICIGWFLYKNLFKKIEK